MSEQLFKVAGITTHNGNSKVRFTDDLIRRVKQFTKGGATRIECAVARRIGDTGVGLIHAHIPAEGFVGDHVAGQVGSIVLRPGIFRSPRPHRP